MAGAAGARHAAIRAKREKAAKARADAANRAAREKKQIEMVFKRYDKSGTGFLDQSELKILLKEYNQGANFAEPSEEEVDFVIKMADKSDTGGINCAELTNALQVWRTYKEQKPQIEQTFDVYDTDKSNTLDKGQLKNLLTDLNDKIPVGDDEVDFVMSRADVLGNGVITKPELSQAIAYWFMLVEAHEEKEKEKKSSVCVVL